MKINLNTSTIKDEQNLRFSHKAHLGALQDQSVDDSQI